MYEQMAQDIGNPKMVYCRTCGHEKAVDTAECLQYGWPKCCTYTMTIDHPDTWGPVLDRQTQETT